MYHSAYMYFHLSDTISHLYTVLKYAEISKKYSHDDDQDVLADLETQ